ncbi:hypothetical protein [Actinomadura sp. KC216]|uniref:hypothetical protein n=1 Tax=Actinomadura sp. KC216 TaxID=2530370 RepID=UPI002679D6B1
MAGLGPAGGTLGRAYGEAGAVQAEEGQATFSEDEDDDVLEDDESPPEDEEAEDDDVSDLGESPLDEELPEEPLDAAPTVDVFPEEPRLSVR